MTAIALTIAGSDSSGGAGIQADLKTFAALGVYGASVITALDRAEHATASPPSSTCRRPSSSPQIDAVFSDLTVGAVKIGMLSQPAVIEAVARGLTRHGAQRIVLDPVMVATSGDHLMAPGAIGALRRLLIPRALVVTPNLPEAAALTGASPARNEQEMEAQAREILSLGARNVLIKGGHGEGPDSVDLLIGQGEVVRLLGAAHRHQEHARQRLHHVFGHRGRPRQGPRPRRRRTGSQGLRHRGHRRCRPLAISATATGRCITFTSNGEFHDARDADSSPAPA